MGHELIRYLTCQRRLISEPIERCFDSIAEQVEHASQGVSRSLRFPLTPLEKRAQRNDGANEAKHVVMSFSLQKAAHLVLNRGAIPSALIQGLILACGA